MQARLQQLFEKIENAPLTLGIWVLSFAAIITIRLAIENLFIDLPFHFADHYFYFFTDFFFSSLFTLLLLIPIIRWAGNINFTQAANLSLFSSLIFWLPPIVDEIISQGRGLLSFYSFDSFHGLWGRYMSFFGDNPEVAITYGVRFEVGCAIFFIFLYTLIKSRGWWRATVAAWLIYTALFIILAFPSIITIPLVGIDKGFLNVTENDIAAFMLTPEYLFGLPAPSLESVLNIKVTLLFTPLLTTLIALITFVYFRQYFWALLRNARLPQVIYHAGLFLVGGGLVYLHGNSSFVMNFFHFSALFTMIVAVVCAWLASVVVNDLNDISIDRITNPHRPLIEHTIPQETYKTIGLLFFFTSITFAGIISTQAALLLIAYQGIAYLYSSHPLRLKRYPLIATLLAAAASLVIFLIGYLIFSAEKNLTSLPWSIPTFLFIAYTFLIPIKDFKDIPGDRADGVFTLPVLLGETRAKQLIGGILLIIFMASVFIFDVTHLFFLAFFFGSIAYWLLQISSKDHKYFNYHHLAHWYVTLVSAYVFFLALQFIPR